jgi:hypothetical protein
MIAQLFVHCFSSPQNLLAVAKDDGMHPPVHESARQYALGGNTSDLENPKPLRTLINKLSSK